MSGQKAHEKAHSPGSPVIVAIGDSLTEHGNWPEMLAEPAGWRTERFARAGQTSTEIALGIGAIEMVFSRSAPAVDGCLPLTPIDLPGDFRHHVEVGMADIEVPGTLAGIPGILAHRVDGTEVEGWVFRSTGPAPDETPELAFQPEPPSFPAPATFVIWCGRNNPGPGAARDIDAIVRYLRVRVPEARYLVLGVHAASFEPAGSEGAVLISALNATLAETHGDRFVDLGAAFLRAAPSPDGTTAARLRSDDVHLNAAGDAIVAEVVAVSLTDLGWWPEGAPLPS